MCNPTWQSDGEWAQSKVVDSQDQQVMSSQRIDILIFALEDAKRQSKPLCNEGQPKKVMREATSQHHDDGCVARPLSRRILLGESSKKSLPFEEETTGRRCCKKK
jgi:hypothetical protein